jgi:prepilin-type N-terminal cleavage/methylation domain-containing protein
MPHRSRAARGFTLFELIVVVAIIAVSAAIAIPAVQSGRHQREVRSTLQHFVAAVREASSQAILKRRTVELWISPDENAYALALPAKRSENEVDEEPDELRGSRKRREREDERRDEIEEDEGREIVARVALPESASFGDIDGGRYLPREVIAFPFFPTGGSGGGAVEFVFERGTSRQSYVITIDPLISSVDLKGES